MNEANKIGKKLNIRVAVTTLCVVAAGCLTGLAQDAPYTSINQNKPQAESTPAPGQPTQFNKCSQLIGTAVENPQGDKLGKIEEVVVDFNNGRVSYCVLGVEQGMFSKAKYLAVPLAAFRPNADGTRLILNASKDKVAQAQGFDRDHWPSVTNPVWGAQPFWQAGPKTTIPMPANQNKTTGTSQ